MQINNDLIMGLQEGKKQLFELLQKKSPKKSPKEN